LRNQCVERPLGDFDFEARAIRITVRDVALGPSAGGGPQLSGDVKAHGSRVYKIGQAGNLINFDASRGGRHQSGSASTCERNVKSCAVGGEDRAGLAHSLAQAN